MAHVLQYVSSAININKQDGVHTVDAQREL